MIKFENLNLFDALQQIVDRNTKHYKTDLEYDIEAIQKNPDCDTWWWMSRDSGTQIDRESQIIFRKRPSGIRYHMDADIESEHPLIYIINIKDRSKRVIADLYRVALGEAVCLLDEFDSPACEIYHYKSGKEVPWFKVKQLSCDEKRTLGDVDYIDYKPYDLELHEYILQCLAEKRKQSCISDFQTHLLNLDSRLQMMC